MRDAGNLGSQEAQTCRAPCHLRAVTASRSPPPRVDRSWRTFHARIFGSRWPAPASVSSCVFTTCATRAPRGSPRTAGIWRRIERSPRALADSGHVRSVRAPVPADSSGTCRRARRDLQALISGRGPPDLHHESRRAEGKTGVPKWAFPASPTGDMSLAPRRLPCALGGWRNVRRLCGSRALSATQTLIGIGYWCLIPGPTARRDEEPQRDTCSRAECQRAYASNDADCLTEREVGRTREPEQTSKNPSGNDENAAACHARGRWEASGRDGLPPFPPPCPEDPPLGGDALVRDARIRR
jgi:hypothetical protein